MDFNKALSQTKVKVMMTPNTAFISSVLLSLHLEASEDIPTACTEGTFIKFNPEFFLGLTAQERVFLVLHECWHVVHEDPIRMKKASDPKRMNAAADYYINNMLKKEKHHLIKGGLYAPKYDGMTIQQIYDALENQEPEDNTLDGDVQPFQGDAEKLKNDVQEIVVKAAMQAEMAGQGDTLPSHVRDILEKIRNPKLPWHQTLEKYMQERVHDEYSWARRNRRISSVYLPSLWNEGMGEIRSYIDCSGSVSQHELALEVKEMCYIQEVTNPSKMTLRAFSHTLGKEQSYARDEDILFDADVSGGTSLLPVWRDIQANPETEVVVIFTDGYVQVPPVDELSVDVVFVIVNNPDWKHPDCTVLHMEIGHGD